MSREKILVVSLNFRPAHVSHLIASYKQYEELGYNPILYIHPGFIPFLPSGVKYCLSLDNGVRYSVAIFWFPCIKNIWAMARLRLFHRSKILYVYHEPLESYQIYRKAGNSHKWIIKFYLKNIIGLFFLLLSNKVLLPSRKAITLYKVNHNDILNRHYCYFPLVYDDEVVPLHVHRKYFSYIGTISPDHAFRNYMDFIYRLYKEKTMPNLKFLIATKYTIEFTDRISELVKAGVLKLIHGHPMSNEEINTYYASSYIVWNAYNRSTQSGVLAKAFLFGTPAIVMRQNLSEFIQDRQEVVAIKDNSDYEEMVCAINTIISNFSHYSESARKAFERYFYYHSSNAQMSEILKSIKR